MNLSAGMREASSTLATWPSACTPRTGATSAAHAHRPPVMMQRLLPDTAGPCAARLALPARKVRPVVFD